MGELGYDEIRSILGGVSELVIDEMDYEAYDKINCRTRLMVRALVHDRIEEITHAVTYGQIYVAIHDITNNVNEV